MKVHQSGISPASVSLFVRLLDLSSHLFPVIRSTLSIFHGRQIVSHHNRSDSMPATRPRPFSDKWLGAMIAVDALPGAPSCRGDVDAIVRHAIDDLAVFMRRGIDAIVLENSFDLPYIKPPLPTAAIEVMHRVAAAVRQRFDGLVGIQMLEAANETALDIAAGADLDFVRVEGYVFAHIGGAGLIEGCAGQLHRQRVDLQHQHIKLFGDIKKKHCAHALTGDLDIMDIARQSEFFLADGIIVTGSRTGEAPDCEELARVKTAVELPIIIGSGMTAENIETYFSLADGFIVGSTFRCGGNFMAPVESGRVDKFMERWNALT
jgi:membrane complex biogenesis BtpA family protein